MVPKTRGGLGKGLGALIPTGSQSGGLRRVPIDAIEPNPHQPRTEFDDDSLQELADSIREVGLIQPLIVHRVAGGDAEATPPRYQLITGERRLRASKMAGLKQIDVIIKETTPREMLELALVENLQRDDLNPIEQATAFDQLRSEFALTQEQIAERVGRSRASVANTMRLLRLPKNVRSLLASGEITEGHGRALLMIDDATQQETIAQAIVGKHLSVRQTEELVRRMNASSEGGERERTRAPETVALESRFREALGTKVDLFRSRKGGRVVIHFYSEEELQALYDRLSD